MCCCLLFSGIGLAQSRQPTITLLIHRITDQTGTLSNEETAQLESLLERFEHETSNQIVVFMISTTGEEAIEEYSYNVAETNKLGKKGKDNGVLVLIAKDDRHARIEVGRGLEGALTDALSSQIIRKEMFPYFRDNNFYAGIEAGVNAIMAATKGEYTAEPEGRSKGRGSSSPLVVILLFIFFGFFSLLARRGRRMYMGSRGYSSGGPWWWGGGGGFGGGGFCGGGGFSGGGGSFGGGGASGSW